MAITIESKGDEIDGLVTGIYVSADLVGIASHGGERSRPEVRAGPRQYRGPQSERDSRPILASVPLCPGRPCVLTV